MARGKTLRIYLAADLKNFNRGMGQAQTGIRGLGDSVSKYLGPALIGAAAGAGAFAVKLGVDAVNAASDLMETQNKVAQVFGRSTDSILEFASTAVTALGQTEEQALDASAEFAAMGKNAGLADQELVKFSSDLVKLASDLASFNNTSPEQAIEAISSALRGSTKPIRAYKILLDDASLRQEAFRLGISDGNSQLTAQQKVLASSSAIFEQAGDQIDDFSRTSDGLANTTRILTAAVKQAQAEVGVGMVEAIEAATAAMGGPEGMANAIEETGSVLTTFTKGVSLSIIDIIDLTKSLDEANTSATFAGTSIKVLDAALVGLRASAGVATLGLSEMAVSFFKLGEAEEVAKQRTKDLSVAFNALQMDSIAAAETVQAANKILSGSVDVATKSQARQVDGLAGFVKLASQAVVSTDDLTTATGRAAKATETLTKWEVKAAEAQEILQKSEGLTAQALDDSVASFMSATQAVKDYASAIQGDLLSGIDLGAAFEGQIGDAETAGVDLVDAFNKQIEDANYFGTVLNSIKAQGVDKSLIDAIASLGPETGAALGEQMILEGLIPSINEKWVGVQTSTADLAQGLVPEFMTAGVDSAAGMVTSLATQLQAEQKTLKKLGKNMAKPVGSAFKSRLAKDVAEAVRNVEAAATAARAEKVASATSAQQRITDQAVALAIQNVIRRGDARAGASVQPVLT